MRAAPTEVEGIEIVLTLDLSLSMQAADIKPNRFDATKEVVDEFIRRRTNDRIGAVIFGRDAYTLMPLTTDHQALRTSISELELDLIDGRGTAIGNGIGVALNRLRKSTAKSKVVILATDGDSNSGNVSPLQAAEFARALGVKVYTILMGRSGEAPVQTGNDLFGRPVFDTRQLPDQPGAAQAGRGADRRRSLPGLGPRGPRAQLPYDPGQARAFADRGRRPRVRRAVPRVRFAGAVAARARTAARHVRAAEVAVTWHSGELLWLLCLLPVLSAVPILAWRLRRTARARFGGSEAGARMIVEPLAAGLRATRAVLLLLGIALTVVALARPAVRQPHQAAAKARRRRGRRRSTSPRACSPRTCARAASSAPRPSSRASSASSAGIASASSRSPARRWSFR